LNKDSVRLKIRFPLFTKIVLGFLAIVFFIIGATFFIIKTSPVYKDQPEFRVLPVARDLQKTISTEYEAAVKYFRTRDTNDENKLEFVTGQVDLYTKSLGDLLDTSSAMAEGNSIRILDGVIAQHREYKGFIDNQKNILKMDGSHNAISALEGKNALRDSMKQKIDAIIIAREPSLEKTLRKISKGTSDAMNFNVLTLAAAFIVGFILALGLAREITRPIHALNAGLQKVGDGTYETLPIISNDETADLTGGFNMMSDKLKQVDEMRMQMMSEISHEMRTPLQVIKAGCYTIIHAKDGPVLTERQRDAVGKIHQATNRINQFINSFLDVAKMEAGLMKFNFESTDLAEMLSPLIQEMQLIGLTRQINVEFAHEPVDPLNLDKDRMGQVFSNLLSNALKYTPDGGSIKVRLSKSAECVDIKTSGKGCVRIDVQDTGVGIPEADLANLFKKFYQAQNKPLVNEKGSGLGLALVKHVAEAHGGRVSVASQVGVGSTFTLLLPVS